MHFMPPGCTAVGRALAAALRALCLLLCMVPGPPRPRVELLGVASMPFLSEPLQCALGWQGYDWGDLYPFPLRTLPALRYSAANFFLLDLHPNGTFRQGLSLSYF